MITYNFDVGRLCLLILYKKLYLLLTVNAKGFTSIVDRSHMLYITNNGNWYTIFSHNICLRNYQIECSIDISLRSGKEELIIITYDFYTLFVKVESGESLRIGSAYFRQQHQVEVRGIQAKLQHVDVQVEVNNHRVFVSSDGGSWARKKAKF